ncbi:TetR/AcrR family transcriptional regulator [Nocardioides agariphilus]|jgi:AcrR family transcriptional regulator|uniref:TetR/AcrR family transcriptional regulator n=1 Tax=Nocardioides agariphilus TaxID=433664 RepID=A0A930YKU7_9ACTN|nr:TetR/AcrR family transcriptional regulator [Nocardioides agariphilus]MBF4766409.1 TetR/AcrR family transcriptional regulator [Nocardioides agariphilus]
MKTTRKYTMGARAQAVQDTRHRILEALIGLAGVRPFAEITLDAVAERAGVSVQTVLRQFGSRDGLFAEAMDAAMLETEEERRTTPGDVDAAVRTVVDHYESRGHASLLMLAQESHDDVARKATDRGKAMHRAWVHDAFEPHDESTLDLLVVATDVYTWKLLRLDRGHSRAVTERRMRALVDAVLASVTKEQS